MSTKKTAIRLAQAFNAICKSASITDQHFTDTQKQIIFREIVLAMHALADNFNRIKFEDACQEGFKTP